MVSSLVIKELQLRAARSPKREVCGLVDSAGTTYPITNVAGPAHHFIMDKREYAIACNTIKKIGRTIAYCYHSHLNGDASPSDADRRAQASTGLPYLIIAANSIYWLESSYA